MRLFLSYSSADRNLVEPIYLTLRAQGHTVFFDRADLPPGEEYDARIREAIERSQLFVFLVTPAALEAGSYTLTELGIAQKTWESPAGKLLPVVLRPTALGRFRPISSRSHCWNRKGTRPPRWQTRCTGSPRRGGA